MKGHQKQKVGLQTYLRLGLNTVNRDPGACINKSVTWDHFLSFFLTSFFQIKTKGKAQPVPEHTGDLLYLQIYVQFASESPEIRDAATLCNLLVSGVHKWLLWNGPLVICKEFLPKSISLSQDFYPRWQLGIAMPVSQLIHHFVQGSNNFPDWLYSLCIDVYGLIKGAACYNNKYKDDLLAEMKYNTHNSVFISV